jgi:hypothetical protein
MATIFFAPAGSVTLLPSISVITCSVLEGSPAALPAEGTDAAGLEPAGVVALQPIITVATKTIAVSRDKITIFRMGYLL